MTDSKKFWQKNIDGTGRAWRAVVAVLFLGATIAALVEGWTIFAVLFGISSAFCAFEAVRGWCVMRACGIKTLY